MTEIMITPLVARITKTVGRRRGHVNSRQVGCLTKVRQHTRGSRVTPGQINLLASRDEWEEIADRLETRRPRGGMNAVRLSFYKNGM